MSEVIGHAAHALLIPVLTIYAFWARRYAIGINPQSVKQLTHIVAIDDEIFRIFWNCASSTAGDSVRDMAYRAFL